MAFSWGSLIPVGISTLAQYLMGRGTNKAQGEAMGAQEALNTMQAGVLQQRAAVEEPYRAAVLENAARMAGRPRTYYRPGAMAINNPFMNVRMAQRAPGGGVQFNPAIQGGPQYLRPEMFTQQTQQGMPVAELYNKYQAAQQQGGGG